MTKLLLTLVIIVSVPMSVFSQSPSYQVYALHFATAGPMSISGLVLNGPEKDSVPIFCMMWLIKGSNGKNILVDAGFLSDAEDAKGVGVRNYTRPDTILMELGIKPTDITDVILTHPHWDHVDAVSLFPNAQVYIQKQDYEYFVGNAWQKSGNHGGFMPRDVAYLVNLNTSGKLTLVDGDDKELFPGIKVFTGSRHTFNSQYVLVQTGADRVVIASDNIWIDYNLNHLQPPPSYGTWDAAGYVKAMQRMKTLASNQNFILSGHDGSVFKKFPKVTDRIVKIQ